MAGNRVVIKFIGEDSSLAKSLAKLQALTAKDEKSFSKFGKTAKTALDGAGADSSKFSKVMATSSKVASSALSAVQTGATAVLGVMSRLALAGGALAVVKGAVGATAQLVPLLLLVPGAIGVFGAAFATLKIGMAGFSDALGGNKKALDALTPSAKATVLQIQAMKPAWDAVQKATQQALFKGVAQDVKDLGATYLPILHAKLPLIASDFNVMARNALQALKAPAVKGSILEILDNTHKMLQAMPHSLSGVVTGFLTLAGAGSKYLVPLGAFIDKLALKFEHWADGFVNSGKFDAAVQAAETAFGNLWTGASNLVEILTQVGVSLSSGMTIADVLAGGSASDGGPLAFFRDMTQALKDFFAEAQTKDALVALGQVMGTVAGEAQGVLLEALRALRPIIEALAPVVMAVAHAVGDILRDAIAQLAPKVVDLINAFAPWIERQLPKIVDFIGGTLIPLIGRFINFLINNKKGVEEFFVVAGVVIAALSAPIGIVGLAIAGLSVAFIWLGQNISSVVAYIQQVWYGLTAAVQAGVGMILHALGSIPSPFQSAFNAAGDSMDLAAAKSANLARGIDAVRPKDVQVTQHGAEAATGAVQGLKAWLDALPAIRNILVQVKTSVIGNINGLINGARASGGPVAGGKTYLVGERGPELVTMGGSGFVTPNHALGGGGGGSTISFGGNTDSAFATAFMMLVRTGAIQIG